MHICSICDKNFETGPKLGAHIAFVHNRNQKAITKNRLQYISKEIVTIKCERSDCKN